MTNEAKHKITFTLAEIRKHKPCPIRWRKLYTSLGGIKSYGKHTPITAKQLIDSIGIPDALGCLRTLDRKYDNLWRHLACDYAEHVKYTITDELSLNALAVARNHADGKASDEELRAAYSTTRNNAVYVAMDAVVYAAYNAVRYAADDAASAVDDAAYDAEKNYQAELLIKYCETGKRVQ